MISIFAVRGRCQDRLYALLSAQTVDVLQCSPGYLGSTLTRSDDGRFVVHHASWRDDAALADMLAGPGARASMASSRALATVQVIRAHTSRTFSPAPEAT